MVNTSKLELSLLQQKIMRLLFIRAGSSLNMNRIARLLGVSQAAVFKSIPLLRQKDWVNAFKDKESSRWSIELNRENKQLVGLKRVDNLKQLYEAGLVQNLYDLYPGATVILFGSYAHGEDTINSDIDLAVIGGKEKEIDLKFDKILERKIIVNYYKSFKSIDSNLLSNILNGITLKGTVDI